MRFGWLNISGALIVALLLVPNIIYAVRHRGRENRCSRKPMLVVEQVGRYGSMALMVLPLLVREFGFKSSEDMVVWAALCAALLLAYFILWGVYSRRPSPGAALWLAVLPCAIFILRGAFLRHWLLTAFGAVFAVGHIYITWFNNRPEPKES